MTTTGTAILALAFVVAVGIVAYCRWCLEWTRIAEARRVREELRAELASGVVAVVEAAREEMRAARVEMKTFIANNRGSRG